MRSLVRRGRVGADGSNKLCERFGYEPHHLADAAAALNVQLTDEEIRALEEPYTPRTPTRFS